MKPAATNGVRTGWLTLAVMITSMAAALAFQTALPAGFATADAADFTHYYAPLAHSILTGRGLLLPDGQMATANPPGYPLLLATLFWFSTLTRLTEMTLLQMMGLLGMGVSSVLLFLAARLLWPPWPALVAPLVWMTCPFALWLTTFPNTELPFVVVLFGSFYLLWRAILEQEHRLLIGWLTGLLMGVAMLIRAIAVAGGLLLAIAAWLGGRELNMRLRLALVAAILLGNLIAILPWQTWLIVRTGKTVLLGTNSIPSVRDGLTFAINSKDYRGTIAVPDDVALLMADLWGQAQRHELDSLGQLGSIMVDHLRRQPHAVIKLLAIKAARSWYGTDSGRWETATLTMQFLYLPPIVWASITAWRRRGLYRSWATTIWLLSLYFWGMTTIVLSILRYMVPAMGLLCLLLPVIFDGTSMPTRRAEATSCQGNRS